MTKNAKTPEDRVRLSPELVCRELEGEHVILDLKTGTYFGLDEVGSRAWGLFEKGLGAQKVVGKIVSEYSVSREEASRDILRLIGELKKKGLVL